MNAPSPDTCPSAFPPHAVVQVPSLSLSLLSNPRETFWNPIQPSRFDHGWGRTRFVGPDQRGISTLGESFDPSKGNFCLPGCRIFFLFSDFFFFSNFFLFRISTRRSLDDFLIFRYSRFWIFEFVKFISLGIYGFGNF